MISSVSWIPRGSARSRPVRFELSEEEFHRIQSLAAEEESELKNDLEEEEEEEGSVMLNDANAVMEQEGFMVRT
jgi:periodic tryptophan protein 1